MLEGAIEGATKSVKSKLVILLQAIIANERKRVPDYVKITNLPAKSVERYIKQLREVGLIDFSDESTKVGGYFITEKLRQKLSN